MESTLIVNIAADTQDLTTIDTVRSVAGITQDQVSDADMAVLIRQASGICADYLQMPLGQETLTETFWATGTQCSDLLFLSRRPIASITSVTENGTLLVASDDYQQTATGLRRIGSGWTWGNHSRGWGNNVVVVYIAGYALLDSLPYAAEKACIELIKMFRSSSTRDASLRSESIEIPGVQSTTRAWWIGAASDPALPREVTDLLDLIPRPMVV